MESGVCVPCFLQQLGGDVVDFILLESIFVLRKHSSVWVPVLHALVLYFHLVEVHVETVLLACGVSEMKHHLCIETFLQSFLLGFLVVVEIGIKVGDRLWCNVAASHAVLPNNSLRRILVHCLFMLILRFHSDCTYSHCFFL